MAVVKPKRVTRVMWGIVDSRNMPMCLNVLRRDAVKEFCGDPSAPGHKPWKFWRKCGCRIVQVKLRFPAVGGCR